MFIGHFAVALAAKRAGAVVLSHWVLDALVHRPDLPLVPGGKARMGLGLWNSIPATLLVGGAMFAAAVCFMCERRAPRTASGRSGAWGYWVDRHRTLKGV